jgi:flagellar biosynthetic protein FlhB
MSSTEDKQEKPTAKRLKDAREKGQVARSKELGAALGVCAVTLAFVWLGTTLVQSVASRLAQDIGHLDQFAKAPLTGDGLGGIVLERIWWFARTISPLMGVAVVAAVAGYAVQGGVPFSPKALELKWERLSPASGFQKFKPGRAGADVIRACLALAVLSVVTVPLVQQLMGRAPELVALTPVEAARTVWNEVWRLLWRGGLVLFAIGAADFLWQRWSWIKGLRMSRQDIRDELRSQEGSPEVKARVRRIQREMARSRMLRDVRTATVVLTNPTHYAVALRYDRERMSAPIVVAKGQDAVAERIRAIARDASVPIIENPPLARALHAGADLGDPIPSALFTAVAEVLAYLVRIRQLVF